MKKVFLTLAIALGVATASKAQDANNMWVGGTVGLWSSKTTGSDGQLSFKVMPEFGYILSENTAVGVSLGGAHTHGGDKLKFDGETLNAKSSVNTYTISPFLRYTFLKGEMGSLFFDAGAAYNRSKITNGGARYEGLEVGFRPGVAVSVSSKIAIIGKFGFLGWQYDHAKIGGIKTHSNNFGFDFDMSNIQLGMNLRF